MFLHVTQVQVVHDYCLNISFDNGDSGVISLKHRLQGKMFEPLLNLELFATAYIHPELQTVVWANGADLAPEYLLDILKQQSKQAA